MRLLCGWKGVAMEADTTCRCQLSFHIIAGQFCSIVAGMIHLFATRRFNIRNIEHTGDGSNKNISVFTCRPTEVQMAEAQNTSCAHVAEAGWTGVEALHVRSELDCTKGHSRTHKCIAAPIHA